VRPRRTQRATASAKVREDSPAYRAAQPRFIDLFCGIGGFRIAFEKAVGRCVFSSDYDKFSQQTYEANFGEKPHGDIHSVAVADIPAHDILCGGFPCQPFSIAGVSKKLSLGRKHGFEDVKQGNLFFSIADILDFHRPAAFVLENVKNLKGHDGGKTFEIIHRTLTEALGYTVYHKIIDAQSVVPQHRERIFIVGFREWRLRLYENGRAMLRKKRQLRRRGIIGKTQRLSGIRTEVLGNAALRDLGFESRRKQEAELVVECDESAVESGIVQT
jgi:DNA-cytosine methyltransferase